MYLNYNTVTTEITARGLDSQSVADLVEGCRAIVAANADGARRSTLELIATLLSDLALEHGLELTIIGGNLYLGFEFDPIDVPEWADAIGPMDIGVGACTVGGDYCPVCTPHAIM